MGKPYRNQKRNGAPGEMTAQPWGFDPQKNGCLPCGSPAAISRTARIELARSKHSLFAPKYKSQHKADFLKFGAPGEIRTPDQVVRSHLLYPAELRVHSKIVERIAVYLLCMKTSKNFIQTSEIFLTVLSSNLLINKNNHGWAFVQGASNPRLLSPSA